MIPEIQKYLDSPNVTALAKSTRENYSFALMQFDNFMFESAMGSDEMTTADLGIAYELTEKNIRPETLEAFCEYLKTERKLSGKSIAQYITIVKFFLRSIKKPVEFEYKISSEDKKKTQLKKINRWFSAEDVKICLEYDFPNIKSAETRLRNKLLVRLIAETGARIREIANIAAKDFDQANRTVFLRYSKTEPRPAFYSPETAELVDMVFLNNESILGGSAVEKIFPNTERCMAIVVEMLVDLGMKKNKDGRGPHTFRHYVATKLFYESNMSLTDLAFVLGDKPDTIRDNYLHPTAEMLRRRVDEAMRWSA